MYSPGQPQAFYSPTSISQALESQTCMHASSQQAPESLLLDLKTKSYRQLTETMRAFHVPRSDISTASIIKETLSGLSFLYQVLIVA